MNLNLSRLRLAAWLTALFVVVVGAKLWVIQVYGTAVPYWDQWDEARLLFKPWLEGHLTWGAWFSAHNEHRIFFTRALDLCVISLNRQWDPILQMAVNAFIHASYACGLAYCLWVFAGRKNEGMICFLLMPFFALPFAAENTIHGFQSQMYFLSGFSVIAIVGLGFGSPGGARWLCGGLAAAIMALFTMGSGFLASLAVVGLVLLRMLKQKRIGGSHLITLGCGLAVVAGGLFLRVAVEGHKVYQAKSVLEFLNALMGNLAWPFAGQPVMLYFVCLPLAVTAVKYFRADFKNPRGAEFILTLGFWGFLQSAALAYGRVNLGDSSRYNDTLDIVPIASLASWFILAENMDFRRHSIRAVMLVALIWVGVVFGGMWQISRTTLGNYKAPENYLQWSRRSGLLQEDNLRAFVATDNPEYLSDKPMMAIPYPNADTIIEILRNPKLLALMPPACRPSLKLENAGPADAAFVANGVPPGKPPETFTQTWGSYSARGADATGLFVSKPLSATLPKLLVPVCCGSNLENISLALVETTTGRKIELSPKITGRWHTLAVTAPKNPFRLEITDQNHNSWIAVGEIREMGQLSYYLRWPLRHAVDILLAGFCLAVFLAGLGAADVRRGFVIGGFAHLAILLTLLVALAGVWSERNFDATTLAVKLRQKWAALDVSKADTAGAKLQLREALWLQPDDPEAQRELQILGAKSGR